VKKKNKSAMWRLCLKRTSIKEPGMTENGPSQMKRKQNVIKKWRGALRQWVNNNKKIRKRVRMKSMQLGYVQYITRKTWK
jgi:hypothetical protein